MMWWSMKDPWCWAGFFAPGSRQIDSPKGFSTTRSKGFKTNQKLGRDFTVDSLLKEGFQAVVATVGGWDAQMADKDRGQVLPGVSLLIDFMLKQREGKAGASGKKIMILGGGQAALQAALGCVEEGTERVHIVLRKSRDQAPYPQDLLRKAEAAGIRFYFGKAVTRMMGVGPDLSHVEIASLSQQGRAKEQRELIPVDILLTGAGRFPELLYVQSKSEEEGGEAVQGGPVQWETLVPYASPFAEQDIGIFRPGEAMGDYKAVIEAIGAGRRTANSAHRFLTGRDVEAPALMIRKYTDVLNVHEIEPVTTTPRVPMPELGQEERIADPNAEIALGYSEDQAVEEAKRCLQCGLICYRRMKGGKLAS